MIKSRSWKWWLWTRLFRR